MAPQNLQLRLFELEHKVLGKPSDIPAYLPACPSRLELSKDIETADWKANREKFRYPDLSCDRTDLYSIAKKNGIVGPYKKGTSAAVRLRNDGGCTLSVAAFKDLKRRHVLTCWLNSECPNMTFLPNKRVNVFTFKVLMHLENDVTFCHFKVAYKRTCPAARSLDSSPLGRGYTSPRVLFHTQGFGFDFSFLKWRAREGSNL